MKEVTEVEVKTQPDWLTQSKTVPHPTSKLGPQILSYLKYEWSSLQTQMKNGRPAQRAKQAKQKWQNYLANELQREQLKDDPKAAWDIIFQITEWFTPTMAQYNPKNFVNNRGIIATNTSENATILKTHFQYVLNRNAKIDMTIIEEIVQWPINTKLNNASILDKVKKSDKQNEKQ